MNSSTTGETEVHSLSHTQTHQKMAGPVTIHSTASIVFVVMPIAKAAWPSIPCLPTQPTAHQLSRKTLHSTSALQWSAVWGGGEETAGGDGNNGGECHAANGEWNSRFEVE